MRSRRGYDLLVATMVTLLVAAPMLFTNSGFAVDFTNHLWLTWAAGKALVQAGHPSYFLNTSSEFGVFYPWFAFYGGTLYMVVGGISELSAFYGGTLYMVVGGISELSGGHPIPAYVGVTTLAVAGSYLGMMWLGREFGLRGWAAHAPALAVLTSAYISGLTRVGRNQYGYAVVRREKAGSGPVHVVVQTTPSITIALARAISIVALLTVLAVFAWACVQSLQARRHRRRDGSWQFTQA